MQCYDHAVGCISSETHSPVHLHLVPPLLCAHLELELSVLQREHLVSMEGQDVTQPLDLLSSQMLRNDS
jgi:hypothetical protein